MQDYMLNLMSKDALLYLGLFLWITVPLVCRRFFPTDDVRATVKRELIFFFSACVLYAVFSYCSHDYDFYQLTILQHMSALLLSYFFVGFIFIYCDLRARFWGLMHEPLLFYVCRTVLICVLAVALMSREILAFVIVPQLLLFLFLLYSGHFKERCNSTRFRNCTKHRHGGVAKK